MKFRPHMNLLAALATMLGGGAVQSATVNVTNDVTVNTTWQASNTYILQSIIYVRSNSVLTIEPGTVIQGSTNTATLFGRDGIDNLVSGLWVTRGSRLEAVGTASRPIIFTYEGDDLNDPHDVPFNTSGQWGGVVLCGRALLNSVNHVAGQTPPLFERFEGTTTDGIDGAHLFGGTDDNDNSGTLRYVSIRYPGNTFSPARELNGLTMGAVGKGTTIEYVEVLNCSDDAFEWWGGCVNTKYLVAAFCEDDDFDTDQGYRGTNQFWFGIKPPWQGSSDSRGFETDGDLAQGMSGELPKSQWTVHNATLIGRGQENTGFGGGVGWNARDEAAPNVINSVFAEFAVGVLIDNDGVAEFTSGLADLRNTVFDTAVGPSGANANANVLFTDGARMNTVEPALLGGISYTNDAAALNPRPRPGSPLLGNVASQPSPLMTTTYRGAFGPYDHWADCWTALSSLGFLHDGRNLVSVTNDIIANTTWHATNTYLLQSIIYVRNSAVLTIEPGTVIRGSTNTATLFGRDGIDNLVSGLWVTRGSRLEAVGTVDEPIVFTFEGDRVNALYDVPFNTSGQWGGIVLCGRAQLNSVNHVAGQTPPLFERFEGTSTDGIDGAHLFGGTDDNDNSGTLRYVSIRYPGNTFSPARELNGLTMGAVGKGTTIEYVEVLNCSDDAFEWWGGCVNTKYLVAAFCEDDDFDTDQGYRGTNQFWFGIKPPWQGSSDSRGFETDGDLAQGMSGELPKSQWTVHNATLIGRGQGNTGFGGGVGWNSRDEAAPNVINSVFAEFAVGVLIDNDGAAEFTSGLADLRNTVFDTAVGPSGANANANVLFTDGARMNTVERALLRGIAYTNIMCLDPRPQPGSPALTGVAAQPAPLIGTDYRGAFGADATWHYGWTAIDKLKYLQGTVQPGGPACASPELRIARNGASVDITFVSQNGCTYQLQSAGALADPTSWSDDGGVIMGTGAAITVSRPAAGSASFYQLVVQ